MSTLTADNYAEGINSLLYGSSSSDDGSSSEDDLQDQPPAQETVKAPVDDGRILCGGSCAGRHIPADIVRCSVGHSFCLDDARVYAQGELGKGVLTLKCIDPSCQEIFPGKEVLRFIDLNVFAGFPKERLEVMIARVGVSDLVAICPYCVAVVVCGPIGETTEVQCTNSECGKSSCRKCQSETHDNLTCEEARAQARAITNEEGIESQTAAGTDPTGHATSSTRDLPGNVVQCEAGHPFWLDDAKEYAQGELGKGILVLKCIDPSCEEIFPGKEVLRFIDLKVFDGFPKERLEVMIARVGVSDLVEICPYCVTVVVCGPVGKTTEVECTKCKKSSCRKCKKETHKNMSCEEARKGSSECGHCLRKHPDEDIVRCEAGHPFCLDDAKEYAQGELGKGILVLKCIDPSCEEIFPGKEVLRFIDLKVFAGFPKERLEVMIARVGVSDLVVICPHCITVVACGPVAEAVEVECTNPECKKSICRKCQQPAHHNNCGRCSRNYSFEEIVRCEAGHAFCLTDANEYAQGEIAKGDGLLILTCMDPSCEETIPGSEALRFIDFRIFSGVSKTILQVMVGRLGMTELVAICPFCLTVVVPGPTTRLTNIECSNTQCQRSICGLCQMESHEDISCRQYEKREFFRLAVEGMISESIKKETVRVKIENIITLIILRECNDCGSTLVREDGYNRLICGNMQCHLCSENITGDDHFGLVNASGDICRAWGKDEQGPVIQKQIGLVVDTEDQVEEVGVAESPTTNANNLPVRLVLCLDGTGDTAEGSFSAVNGATVGTKDSIKSIFDMVKPGVVEDSGGNKIFQFAQYFQGVGTSGAGAGLLARAGSLFDGATGNGYLTILRNAYKVCCMQLQQGEKDEIFIFGFSRGAFIARALASFLQHVGLIKEEYLDEDNAGEKLFLARFNELLQKYSKLTKKPASAAATTENKRLESFCNPSPRVRLVGAFDTVKAVIPLPAHNFLSHRASNIDFEMDAPGIVDHFRHALALNEARPLFNPDLWKSEANSPDSSYLEAWFFGFHHDIGGGDENQGLALWPLQWILRAATDYGLVLDKTIAPYDVLFSGADNTVEMPHEIAMKMFNMIRYHQETENFGLRLNEPYSLMSPQPRNYFTYLTKPPYLKFFKPKVFLHPSAYLVFDISSAFRIQVYGWKYLRSFLRDRFITIPQSVVPWWEQQTIDSILKESSAIEHLNLLIYGRPGTGKSSLVGKMFGEAFTGDSKSQNPLTATISGIHNIATPLSIPGNSRVCIYYSDGFGTCGSDSLVGVERFLAQQREETHIEEQIHAIWYFLDCTDAEIETSEKQFFGLNFGDIPVLVVLENEDEVRHNIRDGLVIGASYPDEEEVKRLCEETIEKKIGDTKGVSVRGYVRARNPVDLPKNLLAESSINFHSEPVQTAQIKAQRFEFGTKIAFATEECVRTYTIWHGFKFAGKKVAFRRNKGPGKLKLSLMLMEPILAAFNMRFSGDDSLIHSKIGKPWSGLDKYGSGLLDATIPGDWILMCMVDTIIVTTHALAHQQISGRAKAATDDAQPLSSADVERACAWYTATDDNKQTATHNKIKSFLSENDGSPKEKSIANLQMRVIEVVELESDRAQKAVNNGSISKRLSGYLGGVPFLGF